MRWQAGGGSAYTLDFGGPGDWIVNNYLVNDNNSGMIIQVDGPGTTTWTPAGYLGNSGLNSPITINGGTLVSRRNHPKLTSQAIINNATFEFNAPSQSQTLSGVISGTGELTGEQRHAHAFGPEHLYRQHHPQRRQLIVNGAENPALPARSVSAARFPSPVARWDSA